MIPTQTSPPNRPAAQNQPAANATAEGDQRFTTGKAVRDHGEPAELMSDQSSAAWLGVSRATFWRRVADGTLPRPIRLGGRTLWRRSELRAVIDNLTAERDGNPEK